MPPTLTEVAERAGVSLSTASRAFSSPDRIDAETLARVIAAADEIGYSAARIGPASRHHDRRRGGAEHRQLRLRVVHSRRRRPRLAPQADVDPHRHRQQRRS